MLCLIVIEAHPDNELPDLRLDQPFDELREFCSSIDLNRLSETDHAHLPYLIILYKYLDVWKSQVDHLNTSKLFNTILRKHLNFILRTVDTYPKIIKKKRHLRS